MLRSKAEGYSYIPGKITRSAAALVAAVSLANMMPQEAVAQESDAVTAPADNNAEEHRILFSDGYIDALPDRDTSHLSSAGLSRQLVTPDEATVMTTSGDVAMPAEDRVALVTTTYTDENGELVVAYCTGSKIFNSTLELIGLGLADHCFSDVDRLGSTLHAQVATTIDQGNTRIPIGDIEAIALPGVGNHHDIAFAAYNAEDMQQVIMNGSQNPETEIIEGQPYTLAGWTYNPQSNELELTSRVVYPVEIGNIIVETRNDSDSTSEGVAGFYSNITPALTFPEQNDGHGCDGRGHADLAENSSDEAVAAHRNDKGVSGSPLIDQYGALISSALSAASNSIQEVYPELVADLLDSLTETGTVIPEGIVEVCWVAVAPDPLESGFSFNTYVLSTPVN